MPTNEGGMCSLEPQKESGFSRRRFKILSLFCLQLAFIIPRVFGVQFFPRLSAVAALIFDVLKQLSFVIRLRWILFAFF
jgi:hypothetical protein